MLLGLATAVVALAGKNNVMPTWSPDSSRIAFVTDGPRTAPNSHNIWVMRRDGSRKRNLTPDRNRDVDPAWSPDGTELAFSSAPFPYAAPEVEVIAADGTRRRTLAQGSQPAWSPDGKELAYVAARQIRVVAADGTNDRPLVATTNSAASPSWSPDGAKLAYTDGPDVWTVDADGTDAQALRNGNLGTSSEPVWSRDGRLAYVFRSVYGNEGVYGGGGGLAVNAVDSISWDGDALVVTGARDRNSDFDVYRNGTDITRDRTWDEDGTISPDGRTLAYGVRFGHGSEESDIWTLDLRTRARKNLTGVDTGVTVAARNVKHPVLRSVQTLLAGDIVLVTAHVQDLARDDVQQESVRVTLGKTSQATTSDAHGEAIVSFPMTTLRKGSRVTLLIRVGTTTQRLTATL
jgi:Tol biopolymer transport system component